MGGKCQYGMFKINIFIFLRHSYEYERSFDNKSIQIFDNKSIQILSVFDNKSIQILSVFVMRSLKAYQWKPEGEVTAIVFITHG